MDAFLISQMNRIVEEVKAREAEIEALSAPISDTLKKIDALREENKKAHDAMIVVGLALVKKIEDSK